MFVCSLYTFDGCLNNTVTPHRGPGEFEGAQCTCARACSISLVQHVLQRYCWFELFSPTVFTSRAYMWFDIDKSQRQRHAYIMRALAPAASDTRTAAERPAPQIFTVYRSRTLDGQACPREAILTRTCWLQLVRHHGGVSINISVSIVDGHDTATASRWFGVLPRLQR